MEFPRVSQVSVLFTSAVFAFATGAAVNWARPRGRFEDNDAARLRRPPRRPFRGSWPVLVLCILFRLYLLAWVPNAPAACAHQGVESALPLLLAVYNRWSSTRHPVVAEKTDDEDDDEEDDIANDIYQDFVTAAMNSTITNIVGAILLAVCTLSIFRPSSNSTVICPASESRSLALVLQYLGVVLDAIIVVLLWRILQWARTATTRFVAFGWILLTPALFISIFVFVSHSLLGNQMWNPSAFVAETNGMLFHYIVQVIIQSAFFVLIAFTLCVQRHSPLVSATIITFLCGAYTAWGRLYLVGTYDEHPKSRVFLGILGLSIGFLIIAVREHIRHLYISRGTLLTLLAIWTVGSGVYMMAVSGTRNDHPVHETIYLTRARVARWVVQHAKVSDSLRVATREYQERHNGRDPPPKFDIWFDFATARNSEIIDQFKQIDDDLRPFWGMKPSDIQQAVGTLGASRGMAIVSIKNGVVAPQPSPEPLDDAIMGDLVKLILPFAQHLPDMDLPVNLLDSPRVLASWSSRPPSSHEKLEDNRFMWSWEHQHQLGQACPGNSTSRFGFFAPTSEFCWACADAQSVGHFLVDTISGRDLCHQPDMLNLHGFYSGHQPIRPFSDLVPVFSRTKTDQHKDILIPLSRGKDDYTMDRNDPTFFDKSNRLFWRGDISAEGIMPPNLVSSGHQGRLSHLANNASAKDTVRMLLAKNIGVRYENGYEVDDPTGSVNKFRYRKIPLAVANSVLDLDVGISDYSACKAPGCEQARDEFGVKPRDDSDKEKLGSRYVMVVDGDNGPPKDLLKVLRSSSVPFMASVFKVSAPNQFTSPCHLSCFKYTSLVLYHLHDLPYYPPCPSSTQSSTSLSSLFTPM